MKGRSAASTTRRAPSAGRRAGYVVDGMINAVLLWVAQHLLDWGWPSFLTSEFDDVLPIISLSFIVAIAFDIVLLIHDPPWLKALDDVVGAVVGFVAAWRTFTVFPFDFSEWGTDWSWLLRTILVVAMVGTAIAAVVGTVRLVRSSTPGVRVDGGRRDRRPDGRIGR